MSDLRKQIACRLNWPTSYYDQAWLIWSGLGISHTGNRAAPTWTCRAGWCASRSTARTAAEPRVRWCAGARGRYARARSLLTSHGSGCPGLSSRASCLLSQGASAHGCDEACDNENVFQAHVITMSAHYTKCPHLFLLGL